MPLLLLLLLLLLLPLLLLPQLLLLLYHMRPALLEYLVELLPARCLIDIVPVRRVVFDPVHHIDS